MRFWSSSISFSKAAWRSCCELRAPLYCALTFSANSAKNCCLSSSGTPIRFQTKASLSVVSKAKAVKSILAAILVSLRTGVGAKRLRNSKRLSIFWASQRSCGFKSHGVAI